jgi:hypothetical protein
MNNVNCGINEINLSFLQQKHQHQQQQRQFSCKMLALPQRRRLDSKSSLMLKSVHEQNVQNNIALSSCHEELTRTGRIIFSNKKQDNLLFNKFDNKYLADFIRNETLRKEFFNQFKTSFILYKDLNYYLLVVFQNLSFFLLFCLFFVL